MNYESTPKNRNCSNSSESTKMTRAAIQPQFVSDSAGPTSEVIQDLRQSQVSDELREATPTQNDLHQSRILVVDDEPINLKVVRKYLSMWGFQNVVTTTQPLEVMKMLECHVPDLILLDVMMPEVNGIELLTQIKSVPEFEFIPVLILTAHIEPEIKTKALSAGAADFLGKPIDPNDLLPRVRNLTAMKAYQNRLKSYTEHLEERVRQRTRMLAKSREDVIHCLARAAEYRDNNTGRHILRVGRYAAIIAQHLGMPEDYVQIIEHAAKLHDIGKIGIPDHILLKPNKLEPEEYEVMQTHCGLGRRVFDQIDQDDWAQWQRHVNIGALIMEDRESPMLQLAARIAMTHHEKWDGSGYPLGLAGEDIPLEGRITAVADVFDALSSSRPYKAAFPLDKCFAILDEGRGKHFDPKVLDAFYAGRDQIIAVQLGLADVG